MKTDEKWLWRICLFLIYITGLFAGVWWLQVALSVISCAVFIILCIHFLLTPLIKLLYASIEDRNDGYFHYKFERYATISEDYALFPWLPFSKSFRFLADTLFLIHYYRVTQDHSFTFHHTKSVYFDPRNLSQKSYVNLRWYMPSLFSPATEFEGRFENIRIAEVSSEDDDVPFYFLTLRVKKDFYGLARAHHLDDTFLNIKLSQPQAKKIEFLAKRATAKDAHLSLVLGIHHETFFRRLLRFYQLYAKQYHMHDVSFSEVPSRIIPYAQYHLGVQKFHSINDYSFIPSNYYRAYRQKNQMKAFRAKGAIPKGPTIRL